jgi:hypothetical protein
LASQSDYGGQIAVGHVALAVERAVKGTDGAVALGEVLGGFWGALHGIRDRGSETEEPQTQQQRAH